MQRSGKILPLIAITRFGECVKAGDVFTWHLPLIDPWPRRGRWKAVVGFLATLPAQLFRWSGHIKAANVGVVNIHFPGMECLHFVVLKRLRLFRGTFIISLHGAELNRAIESRGIERLLWKTILCSADAIVTCSAALASAARNFETKLSDKVVCVHNGVDVAEFSPISSSYPRPNRTIVSIGRFEHKKGHDILIRAFELLISSHPD